MTGPINDLPHNVHHLCDSHKWARTESVVEAINFMANKVVKEVFSWEPEHPPHWMRMYEKSGGVMLFTDNTGFAIVMDSGWAGTDVTPGDPVRVDYYILTPISDATRP